MGIALLAASAFVHPLHALGLWWRRQRTHAMAPACRALAPSVARHAAHPGAALRHAISTTALDVAAPSEAEKRAQSRPVAAESARTALPLSAARATGPHRAVRVLRRPGAGSDRLVISGRMVDVCAELERLAAREVPH